MENFFAANLFSNDNEKSFPNQQLGKDSSTFVDGFLASPIEENQFFSDENDFTTGISDPVDTLDDHFSSQFLEDSQIDMHFEEDGFCVSGILESEVIGSENPSAQPEEPDNQVSRPNHHQQQQQQMLKSEVNYSETRNFYDKLFAPKQSFTEFSRTHKTKIKRPLEYEGIKFSKRETEPQSQICSSDSYSPSPDSSSPDSAVFDCYSSATRMAVKPNGLFNHHQQQQLQQQQQQQQSALPGSLYSGGGRMYEAARYRSIKEHMLGQQAIHSHSHGSASSFVTSSGKFCSSGGNKLFQSPIPHSGMLLLTEEEKRTLLLEGYSVPTRLPLSKQEERNLKKVRRKIKNKISAQESRRKKKEYMEALEKKVEYYAQENVELRQKLDNQETINKSLLGQLRHTQQLIGRSVNGTTASTCLMLFFLCFSLLLVRPPDTMQGSIPGIGDLQTLIPGSPQTGLLLSGSMHKVGYGSPRPPRPMTSMRKYYSPPDIDWLLVTVQSSLDDSGGHNVTKSQPSVPPRLDLSDKGILPLNSFEQVHKTGSDLPNPQLRQRMSMLLGSGTDEDDICPSQPLHPSLSSGPSYFFWLLLQGPPAARLPASPSCTKSLPPASSAYVMSRHNTTQSLLF